MNKQAFIEELKKNLEENGVCDVADILADYEEHFARKAADGYGEEEIAKKLGAPGELAREFAPGGAVPKKRGGFLRASGLICLDLVVFPLFVAAFAWALSLFAAALAFAAAGVCLIASPLFAQGVLVIPYMPYAPGALLGGALVALAALFIVFTAYSFMFVTKSARAYGRWHKAVFSGRKGTPYAVFPLAGNRAKRALRIVTLLSLTAFALLTTVAFIMMASLAGNVEFWHVWGWFGYVAN